MSEPQLVYFLCDPRGTVCIHTVSADRNKCWELGIRDLAPITWSREYSLRRLGHLMDKATKSGWHTVAYRILPDGFMP